MRITDWDDAYRNAAYVPGADAILDGWSAASEAFRRTRTAEVLTYGNGPRRHVDLYRPDARAEGTVVFVHGGYWQMLSGAEFAHLAAGPLGVGWAMALVTYPLAPDAALPEITQSVRAALLRIAGVTEGPLILVGHSAGGHLVSRMACAEVLPDDVSARIRHVMSISGVHDLRPLLRTEMATPLGLTPEVAAAESPVLLSPMPDLTLTCVVGAKERPEFLRQSQLLANIWTGLGADTREVTLPDRHHFDVLAGLADPQDPLTDLLLAPARDVQTRS